MPQTVSISLAIVLALIGSFVSQCSCRGAFHLKEHVNLPEGEVLNLPEHADVRDAMLAVELDASTGIGQIFNQFEKLQRSAEGNKKHIYETLLELKSSRSDCSPALISTLKSYLGHLKANPAGELSRYFNFGKQIIGPRVHKCASVRTFVDDKARKLLDEIDPVFSKFFDIYVLEERKFTAEVKKFDLNELSRIQARHFIKAAGGSTMRSLSQSSAAKPVREFFDSKCDKMEAYRAKLDALAMANFLVEYVWKPVVLDRFAEYGRICLDWRNAEKRANILANLNG